MEPENRLLVLALLATLLFLQALRAFIASIYYQNLVTLAFNASAAYTLLLFAPAAYLLVRAGRTRRLLAATALLLAVARVAMNPAWGSSWYLPLSGLAVAAFLLLLPALVRVAQGLTGDAWFRIGVGMALALASDTVLFLLSDTRDLFVEPLGLAAVLPLGVLVSILGWGPWPTGDARPGRVQVSRARGAAAGLSLGAWLFLEYALLTAPASLARWTALPLPPLALASVGGVAVALASTLGPFRPPWGPRSTSLLGGVAVVAFLDYALLQSPVLPALLLVAQTTLVILLLGLLPALPRDALSRLAPPFLLASFALLLLLFAAVLALTYGYVPLRPLWEGAERVLLPAAAVVAVAGTAFASGGFRRPRALPRTPAPVAAVLATLLVLLAVALVPATPAPAPPGATLRILTYNVHQGFSNRGAVDPEAYAEVLRAADADLVALQESDTARLTSGNLDLVRYLADRLGYHAAYGPPTRAQSFGIALLSRYPLLQASHAFLTSSIDRRALLMAQVEVDGQPVWVFVTHFALGVEDREAEAMEVLALTAPVGGLRILAGDLNSCPGGLCPGFPGRPDDVYARVTASFRDAWTEAGFAADDPRGHTYHTSDPSERIDYIFASGGLTVLGAEVLRTEAALAASDHLPVLVTLRLP